jgi:nucleolar protein 56
MYLITKWFGVFLCNKEGIKKNILFPKNVEEITKRLLKIDQGEILAEEKKLVKNLKIIIVSEKRLQKIGEFEPGGPFFKEIDILSEDFGYNEDMLYEASLKMAEEKAEEKLGSEDLQIIHMVNALDDLIVTSNLLSERLDSWSVVPTPKEKVKPLENTFSTVKKEMSKLEKQIETDIERVAPNTSKIVGPLIGARLISIAGGMERLASIPASTIQVLGAEKALFRFKKEGGKPPKHGVIFQHPLINKSPRSMRGKIARLLAAKISIAAKADVFTKRDISKALKEDLDKRIEEIRNL